MIYSQSQDSFSAISIKIQNNVFDMIKDFAFELNITKDQFIINAIESHIKKHKENRKLLKDINIAYKEIDSSENEKFLSCMRKKHKGLLEKW